jgi:DNA invertase Pin-like site-specific DNA recombinase
MSVMRAALYLKGSPGDAGYMEQGDAIELLKSRGWTLVTTFGDPTNRERDVRRRPGILRVLAGARARSYDVLVVSSMDRMFGTLHELVVVLEVLRENDVAFVSAREPPLDTTNATAAGPLLELVQAFASFENVIRKARHTLGMARASAARSLGRPRRRVPMKKVHALRAAGASLREIERELGIPDSVLHRRLREEAAAEAAPKTLRALKSARNGVATPATAAT